MRRTKFFPRFTGKRIHSVRLAKNGAPQYVGDIELVCVRFFFIFFVILYCNIMVSSSIY